MTLNAAKHRGILVRILKEIYADPALGSVLGFKGGTAAYLLYDLNRESLDLDFDLLDETKGDEIFEAVGNIAGKYGKIKDSHVKKRTLFLVLAYDETSPNIKIEINLRKYGSLYEVKEYLGISLKVMVREDMFAHKLVAMFERIGRANRDIFDVWFFLQDDWPINEEIVAQRADMPFVDFVKKCIEALERLSNRGILNGMGEVLDEKQKAWVKLKLLDDTIFNLKLRFLEKQEEK